MGATGHSEHERIVRTAMEQVDDDLLLGVLRGLVGIESPTGGEGPVAEWAVGHMSAAGVAAALQRIDAYQANAVGVVEGNPRGPSVLLYAPLDTFTTGRSEEDLPWAGPALEPHMRAKAGRAGSAYGPGPRSSGAPLPGARPPERRMGSDPRRGTPTAPGVSAALPSVRLLPWPP